nr:MAG TPA: hypothetical protein [Caudoviricetes sp.]
MARSVGADPKQISPSKRLAGVPSSPTSSLRKTRHNLQI